MPRSLRYRERGVAEIISVAEDRGDVVRAGVEDADYGGGCGFDAENRDGAFPAENVLVVSFAVHFVLKGPRELRVAFEDANSPDDVDDGFVGNHGVAEFTDDPGLDGAKVIPRGRCVADRHR